MTRRAVVTLATAGEKHPARLARLEQSLERVHFEGTLVAWRPGQFPAGCPSHLDVPFAFKPYCLAEAMRDADGAFLWLDAACAAVRPLAPLFERIERDGYLLFRNRGAVGEWASDAALEACRLSRDEALELPEVNAAAVGLRTDSCVARAFLEQWHAAAADGTAFRGRREPIRTPAEYQAVKWNTGGQVSADPRVRGHRHDQTVAGVLAARLRMTPTTRGLEPFPAGARVIRRRTRVVVVRDARHGESPVTLERIERARRLGRVLPSLPVALRR